MPAPAVDAVTDEYVPQGAVDDVRDRAAKAAARGPDINYRHGKIVSLAGTTGGYVATTATGVLADLPALSHIQCAEKPMSGRPDVRQGSDDTGWTYAPIIGWIVTVDLEIVTASSRPELG